MPFYVERQNGEGFLWFTVDLWCGSHAFEKGSGSQCLISLDTDARSPCFTYQKSNRPVSLITSSGSISASFLRSPGIFAPYISSSSVSDTVVHVHRSLQSLLSVREGWGQESIVQRTGDPNLREDN